MMDNTPTAQDLRDEKDEERFQAMRDGELLLCPRCDSLLIDGYCSECGTCREGDYDD